MSSTSKCIHCGSASPAGTSCSKSPTKYHVKPSDGQHCIYCGSASTPGTSCAKSPTKKHVR